ncbi:MAG: hypothetical protein M3071_24490 [Actinomycetota bacterium]|nr:hypothetical protein [Actinomycetota bacterium]
MIVICVLLVALLMGAAALTEALASRSHANLDTRQRRALQAADAGLQAVLYYENQLSLDTLDLSGGSGFLGTLADCLVPNLNAGLPASSLVAVSIATGGACPLGKLGGTAGSPNAPYTTFVPVGNHDSYQAEFIPNATVRAGTSGVQFTGGQIVSLGVDTVNSTNKVYARVVEDLAPVDPFKTVEANHDLTFKVLGATAFNGTARTGHKLYFNASLGVGVFTVTNLLGAGLAGPGAIDVGCAGTSGAYTNTGSPLFVPVVLGSMSVATTQTCNAPYWFTRQPISINPSKSDCPSGVLCSSLQGYTGSAQDEIYIIGGQTLTLAPGDYVFCSLQTNGPITTSVTATSAPVRIFIDSPTSSRCNGFSPHAARSGYQTGAGSFVATSGLGGVSGTISPTQVQVYDVGNTTPGPGMGTIVTTGGSLAGGFFLYAPESQVTIASTIFSGTVIGYDVTMQATTYTQSLGLNQYPLSSTLGVFHGAQYVQCTNTVTALSGTVATDLSGC